MKKAWIILLSLLLLLFLPVIHASADSTGVVTASSLNMRKKASTESDVVCVLREGAKVTIKDTSGSWYKVSSGGKTGYVAKKYIKISSSKSSSSSKGSSSSGSGQSSSSDGTCKPGDQGDAVKRVQRRLQKLGYYSGSIDGDYGNGTKTAVRDFQKNNGLTANGTVNKKTLNKLNSSSAKKASGNSNTKTERLDWFNGGKNKIPKGATFKVKDIKTGKIFTCKRWSGYNHLDAEPLTANDTKIMKSIYGHWSWRRRAILVKYDGHVYAASMNGMPHGTGTIKNNNFDGHFCIHFYKSKTHGSGKVDKAHQDCVATAMKHSW